MKKYQILSKLGNNTRYNSSDGPRNLHETRDLKTSLMSQNSKLSPNIPCGKSMIKKSNKTCKKLAPLQNQKMIGSNSPQQLNRNYFNWEETSPNSEKVYMAESYRRSVKPSNSRKLRVQSTQKIGPGLASPGIETHKAHKNLSRPSDNRIPRMQSHAEIVNFTLEQSDRGSSDHSQASHQNNFSVKSRVEGDSFWSNKSKFGADRTSHHSGFKAIHAKSTFGNTESTNIMSVSKCQKSSPPKKKRIKIVKRKNRHFVSKMAKNNSGLVIKDSKEVDLNSEKNNNAAEEDKPCQEVDTDSKKKRKSSPHEPQTILHQGKKEKASSEGKNETERSVSDSQSKISEEHKITATIPDSPKVKLKLEDTYQVGQEESLTKELLGDFEKLEIQYRLHENWLDITDEQEKPFASECSLIYTTARHSQGGKDQEPDD
ncbi:unnamed protein product [Moneuplotes crassus]|uniref:Uncharacterized protein n=1 Tax=Euplotes crassus TaxID=5936 RepID=A0AAD1Y6G6_EUPCR|nr:unnamed protein product [Moneuplotes crassus]